MKLWQGLVGLALIAIFFFWQSPDSTPTNNEPPAGPTAGATAPVSKLAPAATQGRPRSLASAPVTPVTDTRSPAELPVKKHLNLPQSYSDPETEHEARAAILKPFRTGRHISVDDHAYEFLNLRAVTKSQFTEALGEAVAEEMGFVFYSPHQGGLPGPGDFSVVTNPANGRLGVVTGTFILKLRDNAEASAVIRNHGLQMKAVDPDLRLVYGQAAPQADLSRLTADLKNDSMVESLQLEIVQNQKRF